jgi:RNA polymerase sigma-70 factor (ECF subfamily)
MDHERVQPLTDLMGRIAMRGADAEAAMSQFYKAMAGSVFAFIRRRLTSADEATIQGLVVDCMHEVWQSASGFQGKSEVRTWVLGIARHKTLGAVRQRARLREDDIGAHADTLVDESADLMVQLARKQRAGWLAECMQKLPEDHRECLHLLFVEGLPVEDIAHIQDCPSGTVKSRVFHAKAKLKRCLSRWMGDGVPA